MNCAGFPLHIKWMTSSNVPRKPLPHTTAITATSRHVCGCHLLPPAATCQHHRLQPPPPAAHCHHHLCHYYSPSPPAAASPAATAALSHLPQLTVRVEVRLNLKRWSIESTLICLHFCTKQAKFRKRSLTKVKDSLLSFECLGNDNDGINGSEKRVIFNIFFGTYFQDFPAWEKSFQSFAASSAEPLLPGYMSWQLT